MRAIVLVIVMIILAGTFFYIVLDPTPDSDSVSRRSGNNNIEQNNEVTRSAPEIIVEPTRSYVDSVSPSISIEETFYTYVQEQGEDWTFLESDVYSVENGVTYYEVTYKHYELSGGKRRLLINENGEVFEIFGKP